ncbi:hypothetical protein M8C21_002127 [Ambrosia artemisiifolia]|uniref:Uncharacterized protein n=1 Tax=Ambrosia artemisiifolia TaxID=4212 RepID=A0AAD5CFJ8_AMBAR|nr:hypothetical protein M8C21_002127 [Ambrosia artemisiifolia]
MEKLIIKVNKLSLCVGVLVSLMTICGAVDTISAPHIMNDGETLVSANDTFELGFFIRNDSNDRYLGIRYRRISTGTVVWVANKGNPINKDLYVVLKFSPDARLLLQRGMDTVIWESEPPVSDTYEPVARLLDTGNLVVSDVGSVRQNKIIWQSNPSYDDCVSSGMCGPFGTCRNNNYPLCGCLVGFEPSQPKEWEIADWSGGCKRINSLDCGSKDGFKKISGMKLSNSQSSWYNVSMTLEECQMTCKRNCTCTAYANLDIQGGCSLWFGDLQDLRETSGGRELYVRMSTSELEGNFLMPLFL